MTGAAFGALFGGPCLKIGRWRCVLLTNIFAIIGAACTLYPNFTVFVIGRTLYGLAAGFYSLFCPKYLAEIAPIEIKGPIGSLAQVTCCLGILTPFTIGMFYPKLEDYSASEIDFFLNLVFGLPIVLAVM